MSAAPRRAQTTASPDLAEEPSAVSAMSNEVREIDRQLGALSRATDRTAHAIIDAAERMTDLAKWMKPEKRAAFQAELASVMEACAFGDLFGQRLQRSQSALLRLATRIDTIAQGPGDPARTTSGGGARAPLEGPQTGNEGLGQSEIDAFFK